MTDEQLAAIRDSIEERDAARAQEHAEREARLMTELNAFQSAQMRVLAGWQETQERAMARLEALEQRVTTRLEQLAEFDPTAPVRTALAEFRTSYFEQVAHDRFAAQAVTERDRDALTTVAQDVRELATTLERDRRDVVVRLGETVAAVEQLVEPIRTSFARLEERCRPENLVPAVRQQFDKDIDRIENGFQDRMDRIERRVTDEDRTVRDLCTLFTDALAEMSTAPKIDPDKILLELHAHVAEELDSRIPAAQALLRDFRDAHLPVVDDMERRVRDWLASERIDGEKLAASLKAFIGAELDSRLPDAVQLLREYRDSMLPAVEVVELKVKEALRTELTQRLGEDVARLMPDGQAIAREIRHEVTASLPYAARMTADEFKDMLTRAIEDRAQEPVPIAFPVPERWREDRDYPRGALVMKDGGTAWVGDEGRLQWLAVGVRDFVVDRKEGKLILEVGLSDGGFVELAIDLPAVEHAGTWEKDRSYPELVEVAWNGCTWRARREVAAEVEPGTSDDWILVAKQGNRGRKGEPAAHLAHVERVDDQLAFVLSDDTTFRVPMPELAA